LLFHTLTLWSALPLYFSSYSCILPLYLLYSAIFPLPAGYQDRNLRITLMLKPLLPLVLQQKCLKTFLCMPNGLFLNWAKLHPWTVECQYMAKDYIQYYQEYQWTTHLRHHLKPYPLWNGLKERLDLYVGL